MAAASSRGHDRPLTLEEILAEDAAEDLDEEGEVSEDDAEEESDDMDGEEGSGEDEDVDEQWHELERDLERVLAEAAELVRHPIKGSSKLHTRVEKELRTLGQSFNQGKLTVASLKSSNLHYFNYMVTQVARLVAASQASIAEHEQHTDAVDTSPYLRATSETAQRVWKTLYVVRICHEFYVDRRKACVDLVATTAPPSIVPLHLLNPAGGSGGGGGGEQSSEAKVPKREKKDFKWSEISSTRSFGETFWFKFKTQTGAAIQRAVLEGTASNIIKQAKYLAQVARAHHATLIYIFLHPLPDQISRKLTKLSVPFFIGDIPLPFIVDISRSSPSSSSSSSASSSSSPSSSTPPTTSSSSSSTASSTAFALPPAPDLSKLPSFTNSQLKAHLRALGLSSTGKKTVLLAKLLGYYTKTDTEPSPKDGVAGQLVPCDLTLADLDPAVPRLNMDVSALLSMISGTANSTIEELEDSAFTDPALELQVREELNDIRVLALLQSRIEGASMLICESALNSFRDIVSKIGGENEVLRARDLLAKCVVVPDPREHSLSARLLAVGTKRLGDRRNALVFATGECLGIPTITTNQAYVRSAENAGIHLNIVLFPARALSEAKRIRKSRGGEEGRPE